MPRVKALRSIQRLATQLLRSDFGSGGNLWTWQTRLLELQQEIQAEISAEKAKLRKDLNEAHLNEMRWARWNARHLGDAFAWLVLGLQKQAIQPLGDNAPVPIPEKHYGSQGVIVLAEGLAARGWGFPVLHDVTDCLRVGDITFVRPDREPAHLTVEIKTRLMDDEEDDEGRRQYEATVMMHALIDHETGHVIEEVDLTKAPSTPPTRRIHRQAERMRRANLLAHAPNGLIEGLDEPTASVSIESSAGSHWKTLRRLIREAHRDGYAGSCVDAAFYYYVFYNPAGVDTEDIASIDSNALTSSEFLKSLDPQERSIGVYAMPNSDQRTASTVLPLFLWSVPRRAVFELLRRELAIIVLVNEGHIRDRLRAEGFELRIDRLPGTPGETVIMFSSGGSEDRALRGEYHGVRHHLLETIGEFRSLEYLLDVIRCSFAETMTLAVAHYPWPAESDVSSEKPS